MHTLNDIPKKDVPRVVEEALRDDARKVTVTKQDKGKYTISWE